MDKDYIKSVLLPDKLDEEKLIKDGDYIDKDVVNYLISAKSIDRGRVFYKYDKIESGRKILYFMDVTCRICGKTYRECQGKTKTLKAISIMGDSKIYISPDEFICAECKQEKIKKEKEEERNREEKAKQRTASETQYYIRNYLDPNYSFKDGVSAKKKIDHIFYENWYVDNDKIKEVVSNMDYADFLRTPYWDGIRNYKLKKARYCCELCGAKNTVLNVHHKTYKHHGEEHLRGYADKDLIVLCKDCHEKFHDKLDCTKNKKEVD